jgi:hypothetical protein
MRVAHAEPGDDLGAHRRRSGSGERQDSGMTEALDGILDPQVLGAEVMPP